MSPIGTEMIDHSELDTLKNNVSFSLYAPLNFGSATRAEIKAPSSTIKRNEVLPMVMVHYFDTHNSYVFGITQYENNAYITNEITDIDVGKKTERTRKISRKITLEPKGEHLQLRGTSGWYEGYIGSRGGKLRWVELNTLIELDSPSLEKSSLIKIAESMRKL